MPMETCQIWSYCEIDRANTQLQTMEGFIDHDIPNSLTNDELVKRLKELHDRIEGGHSEIDYEDADEGIETEDTWEFVGIARTRTAAIVEWKSDRDHQAITTVIWDRD